MLILACDTSSPALSAALWRDGRLLAETVLQTAARTHSTTLLPLAEDLLQRCGISIRDVDAFACATGPGSFTGIRIGVSSVKAMAYAAGRPAIGVSTLEAMAWPYVNCVGQITCPILDARNQRIFASAWFEGRELLAEDNWLASDFLLAVNGLTAKWAAGAAPSVLVTGFWPGAAGPENSSPPAPSIRLAPACAGGPRAAAIADIAERRLAAGATGVPQQLMPRYLSLTQAERRQAVQHV